ncbi:hypothetical protein TIFTF001_022742 [Ficus carica]|uniref:Ubiquitin-like protease family profile domain-containing protein n=1 Tax=Ficus carica TaxID=3494 RepID=A0AA88DES7_FICCA|nr:hypothetical protein TIFTF001_022742 [Ficus carica]
MVKVYAFPRGISDEPPKENLEQFRMWIKKGLLKKPPQWKRHARYIAKYETLDKPHDLGSMAVKKIGFMSWQPLLCGSGMNLSWFDVNTILIPMHLEDLKHWFIEFKPMNLPGTYPIPVTIMQDIPRQENGGDCGNFTIKNDECLIEGINIRNWAIQGRMNIF